MRILFLSAWFPYPANNGSKLRIFNLLRALAQYHQITLLSFVDDVTAEPSAPALLDVCERVETIPAMPYNPTSWQARLGLLSPKPRSVVDSFSPEMAQCITRVLAASSYDLIIASQTKMAGYIEYFGDVPALFEEVEAGILYEDYTAAHTFAQRLRAGLTWMKHRHYLDNLMARYQASTVVSAPEYQLLREKVVSNGHPIEIIPNCIDVEAYATARAEPEPDTLIYTGSFSYFPNYEAMTWFIEQVLPLVKREIPDVHLTITGNQAGRPLPAEENVSHVGFVDDVRPYVAASWISLAPIWTGGGTRLKILEAMALGTPVVSTTKGAEGINAVAEEHILLADTPADFANAVIRLLQDKPLRQKLSENAYQLVREEYDWTAVAPRLLTLIDRITYEKQ